MRSPPRLVSSFGLCLLGLASAACSLDTAGLGSGRGNDAAGPSVDGALADGAADDGGPATDSSVLNDSATPETGADAELRDASADTGGDADATADAPLVDGSSSDAADAGRDAEGDTGLIDGAADSGDGAINVPDSGIDAAADSGVDSGTDAGHDSGFDAGDDAPEDAGFDAGLDSGLDATLPSDSGSDAPALDSGTDATLDAGFDASGDASFDASADSRSDTGPSACSGSGYTCLPPASGWTIVAYPSPIPPPGPSPSGPPTPPCPELYDGGSSTFIEWDGSAAPASCGCNCTVDSDPSCEDGLVTLDFGYFGACGPGSYTSPIDLTDGTCLSLDAAVTTYTGTSAKLAPLGPTGGSCGAVPTTDAATVTTTTVEVCPLPASNAGAACTGGGTCVPPVGPNFKMCVMHPGLAMTCPTGFSAVGDTVGTKLNDTRSCSECACEASPTAKCDSPTLTLFGSTDCTGPGAGTAAQITPTCEPFDPAFAGKGFSSINYLAAVVDASCGTPTASPTATGNVTMDGGVTVCCDP